MVILFSFSYLKREKASFWHVRGEKSKMSPLLRSCLTLAMSRLTKSAIKSVAEKVSGSKNNNSSSSGKSKEVVRPPSLGVRIKKKAPL